MQARTSDDTDAAGPRIYLIRGSRELSVAPKDNACRRTGWTPYSGWSPVKTSRSARARDYSASRCALGTRTFNAAHRARLGKFASLIGSNAGRTHRTHAGALSRPAPVRRTRHGHRPARIRNRRPHHHRRSRSSADRVQVVRVPQFAARRRTAAHQRCAVPRPIGRLAELARAARADGANLKRRRASFHCRQRDPCNQRLRSGDGLSFRRRLARRGSRRGCRRRNSG
jgi:hypothetical protein